MYCDAELSVCRAMGAILQAKLSALPRLRLSYRKNGWRPGAARRETRAGLGSSCLPDVPLLNVNERIIHRVLFGHALVLVEIGLQLLLGLVGVDEKLLLRAEGQFADIAIRGAGSAPDESNDYELAIRHGRIMAGQSMRSQMVSTRAFRIRAWL